MALWKGYFLILSLLNSLGKEKSEMTLETQYSW